MSSERKTLKIICFAYVVVAVASVVTGVAALVGAPGAQGGDGAALATLGFLLVASGVLYLAVSGAGIRGANTPSKVGGCQRLGAAALVVGVIDAVMAYVAGGQVPVSAGGVVACLGVVLAVLALVFAGRVKAQQER